MGRHSRKSREKLADTLMTMSGALGVAMTAATLVTPIGLIFSRILGGEGFDLLSALAGINLWLWLMFLAFFGTGVALVMLGRHSAFKIYDELYPDP